MAIKKNNLINTARQAVLNEGWKVSEEYISGNDSHLILVKDGVQQGWGLFSRLTCWTAAYESVTGKQWTDLI